MGKIKDRQHEIKKAQARVTSASISDPLAYNEAMIALRQLQGGQQTLTMNYTPSTATASSTYNVAQVLQQKQ